MTDPLADRLHGIIPPVVTPVTEDRTLDRSSAENLYRYMIDAGVHGLFLFGSSGEGPCLTNIERITAAEIALEAAASRIPVLAGVLEPGTDRIIEQATKLKSIGVDGLVVCPPFYFPASQQEVLEHYRSIRQSVDLPIVAYDIPRTTKVKIQLETMLQLAREGTIVGVKDSSGDCVGFRRLLIKRPTGFKMFTGSELLIDSVLLQGADGSVPGIANLAPEPFVRLYNLWKAGRYDEAVELQTSIVRLFDVVLSPDGSRDTGYVLGVMKTAPKLRGVIASNRTFQPSCPITAEQEERIRGMMTELGFL